MLVFESVQLKEERVGARTGTTGQLVRARLLLLLLLLLDRRFVWARWWCRWRWIGIFH